VIAIKPSGVPYAELRAESMVVVDLADGRVIGGSLRPSSDTPTHLVLYRRFESIGGVVHTHSAAATAWAQACRPIPCFGTTHADHFHGAVPVTRDLTPEEIREGYEVATGDVIVETIEGLGVEPLELPAVLVRSHGPFTWGTSEVEAVENARALEAVASMAADSVALAPRLAPIGRDLAERHFTRKHGPGAYYGQRSPAS
jgi:L-ribulose-5-phosphate 4-epimerase